jgi:hypothetical protein
MEAVLIYQVLPAGRRMAQENGLTMIVEIMTHQMAENTNLEVTQTAGYSSSHEEVVLRVEVADLTVMAIVGAVDQASHNI